MESLSYEEFLKWCEYFEIFPIGAEDDRRAFALMSAWGVKASLAEVFPSAVGKKLPSKADSPMGSLRGSALFKKLVGARGGDKIDID